MNRFELFSNRIDKFKRKPSYKTLLGLAKGVARLFVQTDLEKTLGRDCGYAYFQEFIPNNDSDIRVIIIGEKAFGIKRLVRKDDFRASGSGLISYDINDIPSKCIKIAFDLSERLNTDCLCYDFYMKIILLCCRNIMDSRLVRMLELKDIGIRFKVL